jgi:hypothetical protein
MLLDMIKWVILAIRRTIVIVTASILTGMPALALEIGSRIFLKNTLSLNSLANYGATAFAGARVLLGLLFFVFTVFFTTMLWRKTADPTILRIIIYIAVQLIAVSFSLIMPYTDIVGYIAALSLGGVGTIGWWAWQYKWRGSGVAPSLLTGILKPTIEPGQIWFATVPGHVTTKVRPILVLRKREEANGWHVAYFTTQEPKSEKISAGYIVAHLGQIRGLNKENWIQIYDIKTLGKRAFRSYTGLSPFWLYTEACERANLIPDADARTIDEVVAGAAAGPLQASLLSALGISKYEKTSITDQGKVASSFLVKIFRQI